MINRKGKPQRQLTIVLTYTGNIVDAYDAARRVLDAGTLQDAMHESIGLASAGHAFEIVDAEVKP